MEMPGRYGPIDRVRADSQIAIISDQQSAAVAQIDRSGGLLQSASARQLGFSGSTAYTRDVAIHDWYAGTSTQRDSSRHATCAADAPAARRPHHAPAIGPD